MRKIFVSIALLAVMVVLSRSSSAQQPDPALFKLFGPVFRVIGDNPVALANNPGVQKELKMDEDQIKTVKEKIPTLNRGGGGKGAKLDEAAQERLTKMMEKMATLKDVPEDQLEAKIRETFKDEIEAPTKEAEKILKAEQFTRLKQIARQQSGINQAGGPSAYLKSENVTDLKLNDDQKKKIKDINDELQKDVRELRGKGGFNIPPETREKIEAVTKEASEKAAGVLSDEQKSKWKELIGEPYTVRVEFGRPRPKGKDKDD